MMFVPSSDDGYQSPVTGIELKTLAFGARTMMTQFRLKQGAQLPRHSHPHEQTGYLVSGRIRLFVDKETFECGPGDSWTIPGDAEHGAEILEDAVAIEVFSPIREDYLPDSK